MFRNRAPPGDHSKRFTWTGLSIWRKSIAMALNFPNASRSFLPSRRAVQFWGYDDALEISFFVTEEALKRIAPNTRGEESEMLQAFDSNRAAIYKAANQVYTHGRAGSYELTAKSF